MDALGIANLALRRLGERAIASFDTDSTAARVCHTFFQPAIDEVTSEYEWPFATTRAALVLDEVHDNLTEYSHAFTIPSDALRIIETIPKTQYEIEGTHLYSDEDALTAVYLRSIVELAGTPEVPTLITGRYPPKFYLACSLRLASHINIPLNGKLSTINALQQEYLFVLTQAKNHAAMETPGLDEEATLWEDIQ